MCCSGRCARSSGTRAVPAALNRSTSPATVGDSNRLRIVSSTPNIERIRLSMRIADSEWPPSSKKLSSMPTSGTPSTSPNSPQRISSCGVRGARRTACCATSSTSACSAVPSQFSSTSSPIVLSGVDTTARSSRSRCWLSSTVAAWSSRSGRCSRRSPSWAPGSTDRVSGKCVASWSSSPATVRPGATGQLLPASCG